MREAYPWLAVDEIAILFGVTTRQVYRIAKDEEWPTGRGTTGSTLYATVDVLATKKSRDLAVTR